MATIYIYINLRWWRDCLLLGLDVWKLVSPSLHLARYGQLLRCAYKRIVNLMKVYIERNNMQVELIRFRKHISILFTFTSVKRGISRPTRYLHMEYIISIIGLFPCTLFGRTVVTTSTCSTNANSTLICYFHSVSDGLDRPATARERID